MLAHSGSTAKLCELGAGGRFDRFEDSRVMFCPCLCDTVGVRRTGAGCCARAAVVLSVRAAHSFRLLQRSVVTALAAEWQQWRRRPHSLRTGARRTRFLACAQSHLPPATTCLVLLGMLHLLARARAQERLAILPATRRTSCSTACAGFMRSARTRARCFPTTEHRCRARSRRTAARERLGASAVRAADCWAARRGSRRGSRRWTTRWSRPPMCPTLLPARTTSLTPA